MKEVRFIKNNTSKWKELETIISQKETEAGQLAHHFIEITDDLAYSRTYFPSSKVNEYLNHLAGLLYQIVYKKSWKEKGYYRNFWKQELPLLFFDARKEIITAFIILAISIAIGVVSSVNDDTFTRLILGDGYVNMTLENIKNGDPMAVYKSMNEADMFLGITFNNIRVSFIAFIGGLFFAFGSVYVLFTNGVMIGAFMTLFYLHGVFDQALLTVWLHGTIEIASLTVAGAAGFTLGKGFLFPGSYSRSYSFIYYARRAAKMTLGLLPLIILAGIIESFLTRYTDMYWFIKIGLILSSLIFVVYYFFVYPAMLSRMRTLNEK